MSKCEQNLAKCRAEREAIRQELYDAQSELTANRAFIASKDLRIAGLEADLADCQQKLLDCELGPVHPWRPYADTSIWNTPLSNPTIDPNSDALVAQLKADKQNGGFTADDPYSHPVYWSKNTDPLYSTHYVPPLDWGTMPPNPCEGHPIFVPEYAIPERGTDAHMAIIHPAGWEYDFYKGTHRDGPRITCGWGGRTLIDGDARNAQATALGHGLAAGNITGEELAAGEIRHALFAISAKTNGKKASYSWGYGAATTSPAPVGAYPAMGQRFFLDMPSSDFFAYTTGLDKWEVAVLYALREYGLIIGDTGGGLFKAESKLPYTQQGKPVPLLSVRSDGRFVVPIPWEKMKAVSLG